MAEAVPPSGSRPSLRWSPTSCCQSCWRRAVRPAQSSPCWSPWWPHGLRTWTGCSGPCPPKA